MFETYPLPPHALDTFQCGQAETRHFRRLDIWGSGSCFFHSTACLLTYANETSTDAQGNETITYYLAIPSNENIRANASDPVKVNGPNEIVRLAIQVPNRHPDKFYKNAKQVGVALREYLSETVTKERYEVFLDKGFSSDLKWALQDKMPDWIKIKALLANPSAWADIWAVKYAAWALSLNLLFINGSSREEPIFCGVENFHRGPWTLFVFWSGKVHFEPIVEMVDAHGTAVKQGIFLTNHPFVKCLEGRFVSSSSGGCSLPIHKST